MRPTSFGLKNAAFALSLMGAFLASPYTNLFFLLLVFLGLLWAATFAWTWRNLRGVEAHLDEPQPVPAGAATQLHAVLTTPRIPRLRVSLGLALAPGRRVHVESDLWKPHSEVELPLPALTRGVHALSNVELSTSWPFDLMRSRRALDTRAELIVYPAPSALVSARGTSGALAELLGASGARGEMQPQGLRDWRNGDERRSIHWRASARRNALVVREWEGGSGGGVEVVLDLRTSSERLEEALATLSALATLAREDKEVLVLRTQGLVESYGPGHRDWKELLRFLALAQALPPHAPAPPSGSPSVLRLPSEVST